MIFFSLDVSSSSSANDFRNLLQSIKGMGEITVTRSKDCAGFKWEVDWINGGNQIPLTV